MSRILIIDSICKQQHEQLKVSVTKVSLGFKDCKVQYALILRTRALRMCFQVSDSTNANSVHDANESSKFNGATELATNVHSCVHALWSSTERAETLILVARYPAKQASL